jgi:CelD/BcsL family acetyltransferase involved in cellulose biosynthesis
MRAEALAISDPAWAAFVAEHPHALPFHLPAWATLLADCYRFRSFVLAVVDTDGEILAGMPVIVVGTKAGHPRWVSLPFSDACPILIREDADALEVGAAIAFFALASGARDLEVRDAMPDLESCHPVQAGYFFRLDLPEDAGGLRPHKLHRNTRNRAARNGVVVTRGTTAQDVADFYRLHTMTRRRLGVPVQPKRFFDMIAERLIEPGHGFVATAHIDGVPAAAGVYLAHKTTLVAKFGASDPAYRDTGAGYLVDWEMMSLACAEGYRTLDLGRTDLGDDGLRRYKAGWGCTETPLVYTHISLAPPSPERLHVGELPRKIIRNSPLWVCRLLGEVLYRGTA